MTRCQHCKKLTHSEDLNVYFESKDYDKIVELQSCEEWIPKWKYADNNDDQELGKMKIGDIWIHFLIMTPPEKKDL